MTREQAWRYGYREDDAHLGWFGQFLPEGMVPNDVPKELVAIFTEGSRAHTDDILNKTKTNNPYIEEAS